MHFATNRFLYMEYFTLAEAVAFLAKKHKPVSRCKPAFTSRWVGEPGPSTAKRAKTDTATRAETGKKKKFFSFNFPCHHTMDMNVSESYVTYKYL